MRLFLKCLVSRLAPVLLSGFTSQRAGVFSFQQPMPPGIKPPQHCASPDNAGLVWILLTTCPGSMKKYNKQEFILSPPISIIGGDITVRQISSSNRRQTVPDALRH
ncbi:hypothetical protein DTL40_24725 [Escherichia coli]|nr:hypothetical protein DTL40_24725 [Escherichia coli]